MKELEKLVKLVLVPCKEEELKASEWLLMSTSKNTLHVPAAGGEYRRLIQSGSYIPVKPYLVSDDEIKSKDVVFIHNKIRPVKSVNEFYKGSISIFDLYSWEKEPNSYTTYDTKCFKPLKVITTPEQIHGCQIILFNNGVKENFDVRAMNLILRMNSGGCKIQAEYCGAITEDSEAILSEIKAGKLKPKLENGKVVITI